MFDSKTSIGDYSDWRSQLGCHRAISALMSWLNLRMVTHSRLLDSSILSLEFPVLLHVGLLFDTLREKSWRMSLSQSRKKCKKASPVIRRCIVKLAFVSYRQLSGMYLEIAFRDLSLRLALFCYAQPRNRDASAVLRIPIMYAARRIVDISC